MREYILNVSVVFVVDVVWVFFSFGLGKAPFLPLRHLAFPTEKPFAAIRWTSPGKHYEWLGNFRLTWPPGDSFSINSLLVYHSDLPCPCKFRPFLSLVTHCARLCVYHFCAYDRIPFATTTESLPGFIIGLEPLFLMLLFLYNFNI